MAKFKYKNISDQKQVLMGIGEVAPDAIIETDTEINNANFQKIEAGKTFTGVDPVTEVTKKK